MLEFDSKGGQVVAALQTRREYFWFNPERNKCSKSDIKQVPVGLAEMQEAANRLKALHPGLHRNFPRHPAAAVRLNRHWYVLTA